ncbi:MAG: nodulation protein NfeD [Pseudomonadales bacterium]|nr:nodulation protein NfeD [Pseudomonadales bacterium]MBO6596434.1 nodulation protein NfeD [Pseudomonadales bacterium]MBO6822914.1 nodulation protein NfeD [Pseudomonadales bacterium]
MSRLILTIAFALLTSLALTNQAQLEETPSSHIWLIEIDGAIGPATSDYVLRGFEQASSSNASLIVIRINTPGGLDGAMRDIVQGILSSDIPVVSYVGPKGARAASAGTYIAYASHVAAMAPATNLGASTPVQIAAPTMPATEEPASAAEPSAMEKKIVNDAAAYIRGLAELRGRNAAWAEESVRQGVSLNAEAALEENVIDLVVEDLDTLLQELDGRIVSINDREVTLQTRDTELQPHLPDLRTEILSILTNPNVVMILGMIGIYGIILEFYNPGSLIPGVIGVICLLLAAYAVQLLPLNYAGLALLVLGIGLMVGEALVPSFGILGIGGVIAFCIGGLMLFDTEMEAFQVGLPTIGATAVVSALLIFATVSIAMKIRNKKVTTGMSALIGEHGEALNDFGKEGQVRVGGEIWRAESNETIEAGDTVSVKSVNGLLMNVTKIETNKG